MKYVLPNLGFFHQGKYPRGSIQDRYQKSIEFNNQLNIDAFKFIEIPGNYIRDTEAMKLGLQPGSMLTPTSASLLYQPPDNTINNVQYILHTEPCFPRIFHLKWYDDKWITEFINHIESIIQVLGRNNLSAIEIHPGLPQHNKNTLQTLVKGITQLTQHFTKIPIMVENRADNHIVGTGTEMTQLCETIDSLGNSSSFKFFGFALDFQQLYKSCKDNKVDFIEELSLVPIDWVKAIHIHSLRGKALSHQYPREDDVIDWKHVKNLIHQFPEKEKIIVLPEVHNEKATLLTVKFCKQYLDL
jgi:hypothetical protein